MCIKADRDLSAVGEWRYRGFKTGNDSFILLARRLILIRPPSLSQWIRDIMFFLLNWRRLDFH